MDITDYHRDDTSGGKWDTILGSGTANLGSNYYYPTRAVNLVEPKEDCNGKPPPLWLKLFEPIKKFLERKEAFRPDFMVFAFNAGKRGYIPYFPWTLMRRFDVIVV